MVNELFPRISPKRFGTRSVCADLCTVDCYTYCNKVEIHISAITTVATTSTAYHRYNCYYMFPQLGIADAESKVPSAENPDLTNVLPLKPGVGQNIIQPCVFRQH